jgi:hypothetical protein
MIRKNLGGLLLAGVLAVNPTSHMLAHPLGSAPASEATSHHGAGYLGQALAIIDSYSQGG